MKWKNPVLALVLACAALAPGTGAWAQSSNPDNSAQNPYAGSVEAVPLTPGVRQLSLNDAIDLGIQHNLALTLARINQQSVDAQKLQLENNLWPNISLHGEVGVRQINLAANGFRPSLLTQFGASPSEAAEIPLITKTNPRIGQINFSQELFSWQAWDAWRAGKAAERAAYYNKESSLGLVVLNVGTTYLRILADSSNLDYAKSLLHTDKVLLDQAHEEHIAGVVANLDELRARVQYQAQQQKVIASENALAKDKIALNRQIGLAPAQQIQLTDAAPYSNLPSITLEQAQQEAFANRQIYQEMKQKIRAAELEARAIRRERYPTLSFSGNYGVTGVAGLNYHDTFTAMGTLHIPIFHEAKFRGDSDVAQAQVNNLHAQMNDLRAKIDQQVRDSLLDVQTTQQLVSVSKSNVGLATLALQQTTERFKAGVDSTLPVAEAQSTLAQAQAQYVNSVYRYNLAKLGLARNLGVIETQFKNYVQ